MARRTESGWIRIRLVLAFAHLVVCGAVAVLGAQPAHAASTSPGKNAVYASTTATLIANAPATVVTATIEKGKKKRVLAIDTAATSTGNANGFLSVVPIVNGLRIAEPTNAGTAVAAVAECFSTCTSTSHFWLDLDAAEAAHPGVFIKQPLVVELEATWTSGNTPSLPVAASLGARLQKK